MNSQGFNNMILDLSESMYCDSSGLSAILVGNRLCKNSNGSFVISGLSATVFKLIQISQLDKVLNITPSVNEAVDYVLMDDMERNVKND